MLLRRCQRTAPSSSGPGRRPLTAVARVRIPSGLRAREPPAIRPGALAVPGERRGRIGVGTAPSSSGPGRRPLTAVARVRIPSGLHRARAPPPAGGSRVRVERPVITRGSVGRDPDESSPGRRPGDPLLRRASPSPRDAVDTRDLPPVGHPLAAAVRRAARRVGGDRLAPADAAPSCRRPTSARSDPSRARPADRDPGERLPGRRLREPLPVAGHRRRARRARRRRRATRWPSCGRASAAARSSASPATTTASSPTWAPSAPGWWSTSGPTARRSCPRSTASSRSSCFENHGEEIGVTLSHPHGQIYAYPFVTAAGRRRCSASVRRHRESTGGDLFAEVARRRAVRAAGGRGQRALDGVRPGRRPLALRGAAVPDPQGARHPGARPTPSATPSSRSTSTCSAGSPAASTPRCPTSPRGTRRRSRDGPRGLVAAPAAVLAAPRARAS